MGRLWISRAGGTITVDQTTDVGTRVTVYLPTGGDAPT
jgi:hypothetical protein